MISANELRLNNWVRISDGDKVDVPFRIEPHDFEQMLMGDASQRQYLPIPLTPEILEKCGFDEAVFIGKNGSKYKIRFTVEHLVGVEGLPCISVIDPLDPTACIIIASWGVKFVHQLQNLYFALTGEELNVQL